MNETVTLTKSKINRCFTGQDHQADVLIALYKSLYGQRLWDDIKSFTGWPKAGPEVHQYVLECFIRFDKAYHRRVFAGSLWMNQGWSMDQNLEPWEVVLASYVLTEEA